jgi:hypothetical protein
MLAGTLTGRPMRDEHMLRSEYEDYLSRFFAAGRGDERPLSFAEFITAMERWDRDYHAAWLRHDLDAMRELERLLAL